MRITAEKKVETRRKILDCASELFQTRGFTTTTTRDIAQAAGLAAGTLFNYFPTKESLALSLILDSQEKADAEFDSHFQGNEELDERLFAHIASELRCLSSFRSYLGEVLETALSPFTGSANVPEAEQFKSRHLETVYRILASAPSGIADRVTAIAIHLYWTLYLGVLAFWISDRSSNQESTLAVLDHSMKLYVASLEGSMSGSRTPVSGMPDVIEIPDADESEFHTTLDAVKND